MSAGGPSLNFYLVVMDGCPHCTTFMREVWPEKRAKLEKMTSRSGGKVLEFDLRKETKERPLPQAVREKIRYVPQVLAVISSSDDSGKILTVDSLEGTPLSPAGRAEMDVWATEGPPSLKGIVKPPQDTSPEPVGGPSGYMLLAVTSSTCPHCTTWSESGDLGRFLSKMTEKGYAVDAVHYNINNASPPTNEEELRRRRALIGIAVPSVIAVQVYAWYHPVEVNLTSRDLLMAPADPRAPDGPDIIGKWTKMMNDDVTGTSSSHSFTGYLVLSTSDRCPHCRTWKDSGHLDKFLKAREKDHERGILFLHNPRVPAMIGNRYLKSVPQLTFVPVTSWASQDPYAVIGPDPRSSSSEILKWIETTVLGDLGVWENDNSFVPQELAANIARAKLEVKPNMTRKSKKVRTLRRQRIPR